MELEGSRQFSKTPEELWQLLRDPLTLQKALPSFTIIQRNETEDRWEIGFKIEFGQLEGRYQNSLVGTYRGEARVRDENWPNSFWLHITGAGAPGSAAADAGLQQGDVIQEVNRSVINNLSDYQNVASQIEKRSLVVLLLSRRGNNLFVAVNPK